MPVSAEEQTWNERMIADFREHGGEITEGRLKGSRMLLLTTTGARTGQPRTNPVGYSRDGDRFVIVASNSGKDHDPAWVENIRRNPAVEVEVGTERFAARARATEGAERRRLLDAHIAAIPIFGRYEQMTDRELPVVAIERTGPAGEPSGRA